MGQTRDSSWIYRAHSIPPAFSPETWSYASRWLRAAATHDWWHKVVVSVLMIAAAEVHLLWRPIGVVLAVWFLDWFLGSLRALGDPDEAWSSRKAAQAWLKPLAIVSIALLARCLELAVLMAIDYDLAGRVVLVTGVGMIWEDAGSAAANARFWYQKAGLGGALRTAKRFLGSKVDD